MKHQIIISAVVLFAFVGDCPGQNGDYFLPNKHYPFIQYDKNAIACPSDSNCLEHLYQKFDSLMLYGTGKINIVHIGGSHIQADIYTHQIRKRLQSLQYDMNGGRGLIFPYRMAKTNNPSNYRIKYTGTWKYCKNTQYKRTCPLGLNGISVTTTDKRASIKINPNGDDETNYWFSTAKVFHSVSNYELSILWGDKTYYGIFDSISGYTEFRLPEMNEFNLQLLLNDSLNDALSIYGISLDNSEPGLVYNSIGVNGAKLSSYIQCEYYSQHIGVINPDLVIFSIGTNDGNTRYFNSEKYRVEYEQLIEITKVAAPNAHILITVPNDCYLFKRYVNTNTPIIRKEIFSLAKRNNYAIWDFYSIMGGLDSSQQWLQYGLMKYDRIHFNKQGYLLKGDLFVTALLRGWEKNLDKRTATKINTKKNSFSVSNVSHATLK